VFKSYGKFSLKKWVALKILTLFFKKGLELVTSPFLFVFMNSIIWKLIIFYVRIPWNGGWENKHFNDVATKFICTKLCFSLLRWMLLCLRGSSIRSESRLTNMELSNTLKLDNLFSLPFCLFCFPFSIYYLGYIHLILSILTLPNKPFSFQIAWIKWKW